MKINRETIIRTLLLAFALVNMILTAAGKNPLPFSNEEFYTWLTTASTVLAALWAWWKNNSFTKNALAADAYKAELDKAGEDVSHG